MKPAIVLFEGFANECYLYCMIQSPTVSQDKHTGRVHVYCSFFNNLFFTFTFAQNHSIFICRTKLSVLSL